VRLFRPVPRRVARGISLLVAFAWLVTMILVVALVAATAVFLMLSAAAETFETVCRGRVHGISTSR
jgi:hypothetical protein